MHIARLFLLTTAYCEVTCDESKLQLSQKHQKCEKLTQKIFFEDDVTCELDTKCEDDFSNKICNTIFYYDATGSEIYNQIIQLNLNVQKLYKIEPLTDDAVLILVVNEQTINHIDCAVLSNVNVLPVYMGNFDLLSIPEKLQNNDRITVDGEQIDSFIAIDKFSRFLADCPGMCQSKCKQDSNVGIKCAFNEEKQNTKKSTCCGPAGPDGIRGPDGPIGFPGCIGEPGQTGVRGNPAETGYPGFRGQNGPNGENGPKGENGNFGELGELGHPGKTGEDGDHGNPGATGYSGMTGQYGPPGLPGGPGETGEKGATGYSGRPGFKGPVGKPGIRSNDSSIPENDRNTLFLNTVIDLIENDHDIQAAFNRELKELSIEPFCNCKK